MHGPAHRSRGIHRRSAGSASCIGHRTIPTSTLELDSPLDEVGLSIALTQHFRKGVIGGGGRKYPLFY